MVKQEIGIERYGALLRRHAPTTAEQHGLRLCRALGDRAKLRRQFRCGGITVHDMWNRLDGDSDDGGQVDPTAALERMGAGEVHEWLGNSVPGLDGRNLVNVRRCFKKEGVDGYELVIRPAMQWRSCLPDTTLNFRRTAPQAKRSVAY